MLNIKTNKNKTKLRMRGNIVQISAETLCALAALHNALKEENPKHAETFAKFVTDTINDPGHSPFKQDWGNN